MARPPRAVLDDFPWTARVVQVVFRRQRFELATALDLFSSASVDAGTTKLLRTLEPPDALSDPSSQEPVRILDLGCGIGVLGIALAAAPTRPTTVDLADRDRLAVATARLNACANGLDPDGDRLRVLEAGLGHAPGRSAARGPYDAIVSNLPAKVGRAGLRELLLGAGPLLRRGGRLAVVHVTPLSGTIDELLAELEAVHGPVERLLEKPGKEHRVLHLRLASGLPPVQPGADALAPWRRTDVAGPVILPGVGPVDVFAVHNVEEFDTEHFRTPLIAALVERARPSPTGDARESILVLHPDHGLLAARLLHARRPRRLHVLGRDTLALATSLRMLAGCRARWGGSEGIELAEAPGLAGTPWLPQPAAESTGGLSAGGYDLIVGRLLWEEGPRAHARTLESLRDALADQGRIVLAIESGRLLRLGQLAASLGLRAGPEARRRGHAAVVLRRS